MNKATQQDTLLERARRDARPVLWLAAVRARLSQLTLARLDVLCTPGRAAAAIALIALAYGLATMRGHGITYDEPALNYAGDRTLYWLQHWSGEGTLDFNGPEPADFHSEFTAAPIPQDPQHYPVLPGLIAAMTSWFFHLKLEWTDAIDGHHIGLLLMHAVGLFAYGVYMCRLFGRAGGIGATIALALYPCAIGHAFNNAKDWPCAMYYGVFLLALGSGVVDKRFRDLLIAGVVLGVAFAAKMNAVFALATMVVWAPIACLVLYYKRPVPFDVATGLLLIPYLAGGVFFVTWPWLYQGKVPEWWMHIYEYVSWMVNYGVGKRETWSAHALDCIFYMSQPLVLAASLVYLVTGWRGDRRTLALYALLVLWLGLPILRMSVPSSNYYDANRHFIEYVPALAAFAGVGAAWVGKRALAFMRAGSLGRGLAARAEWLMSAAALAACALLAWPVLEYRPFEATYFNVFAGGLGGAQEMGLFAAFPPTDRRLSGTEGDYWYGSTRRGLITAAGYLKHGEAIGLCGPPLYLAEQSWAGTPKPPLTTDQEHAAILLVSLREGFCGTRRVRELESQRPILRQATRGGGLIYEVLSRPDGKPHPIRTPESFYTRPDWPPK